MELVPLFFLVPPSRRLHLWSVHHHHLCQRWPGGDRKPDAPLPVSLPSKLHGVGLQVPSAVHHRAPGLHRQPPGGHVCTEIFSFEGLSAQCVLCRVHRGRSKYHKYFYTLYAPEINWRKIPSHFVEKRLFFLEVSSDPGPQTTDHRPQRLLQWSSSWVFWQKILFVFSPLFDQLLTPPAVGAHYCHSCFCQRSKNVLDENHIFTVFFCYCLKRYKCEDDEGVQEHRWHLWSRSLWPHTGTNMVTMATVSMELYLFKKYKKKQKTEFLNVKEKGKWILMWERSQWYDVEGKYLVKSKETLTGLCCSVLVPS